MSCETCGGRGHVCIDDICAAGECIHGDAVCPECYGDPENEYGFRDDPDDDYPSEDE